MHLTKFHMFLLLWRFGRDILTIYFGWGGGRGGRDKL